MSASAFCISKIRSPWSGMVFLVDCSPRPAQTAATPAAHGALLAVKEGVKAAHASQGCAVAQTYRYFSTL